MTGTCSRKVYAHAAIFPPELLPVNANLVLSKAGTSLHNPDVCFSAKKDARPSDELGAVIQLSRPCACRRA